MAVRKLVLAAVALATVAMGAPAHADDVTVLAAVNRGLLGAFCAEASVDDPPRTYRVEVCASFSGALTPNNTLVVQFYGASNSLTSDAIRVPQLTYVKVKIKNASGNSTDADLLLNGNASAIASSTALAEDGPKEWPVEDITICAQAFGLFGNSGPVRVDLPETCVTPTP